MLSLDGSTRQSVTSGVLYLHGFNSGSGSPKARLMSAACQHVAGGPLPCSTPQLSHLPYTAYGEAERHLDALGECPLIVGSSMGGFLATCLAERHDLPTVLINPAVRPAGLVEAWLGERLVNEYTGEQFTIDTHHRDDLQSLTPAYVDPARYLLLLGTADETLDCRAAFEAYRGCRTLIVPKGDHGFSRLVEYLPAVLAHGGHRLTSESLQFEPSYFQQ
ncbi:YqiA/YcfP family alpha/beta fold hydrolase [Aidingimonas lacisalsi]|uniref:YqiA/YcfP family alpha/beta fold hydrolase n=1 Tax=Aidingimonas lacisalsi TaxID=2604086 RepID=UPI0011D1D0E0|nr:YqiA/YcfP family alpha/beta fold hydrolase [Aidingimonas lacisalsi]